MPVAAPNLPRAVAFAISNDRNAVVSYEDARSVVGAAMRAIQKSSDPQAEFESQRRLIDAAMSLLGVDKRAKDLLGSWERRGLDAVTSRLGNLTGETQLPVDLVARFGDMLSDVEIAEGPVTIKSVRGNSNAGFEFDYAADGVEGTAFALQHDGSWFFAPQRIDGAALDQAVELMQQHFDEYFAEDLPDWGYSPEEITEMRDSIGVDRVYFPGESSDPYGFVDDYPLVFAMTNPTDSDHGFFAGLDPATGDGDAYTFN